MRTPAPVSHDPTAAAPADDYNRRLSPGRAGPILAGSIVVFSFCLAFLLPWWNRYLGLTSEGWLQFFGLRILQGFVPYRDFYLHVPPSQAFTMSALISVFGDRIVVGEMFGLLASLALFCGLYVWLARMFQGFWPLVGVLGAAAIYLNSSAETLGGVHLVAILYPVLAFLAASLALDREGGGALWIFVAGFLSAISFLTKQTAGVAATLTLGVGLPALIAVRVGWRRSLAPALNFAIGWGTPIAFTGIWLWRHGALRAFVEDAFLHGASSKGSLGSLLARQIAGIAADRYLRFSAALALAAVLVLVFVYQRGSTANRPWPQRFVATLILGFGVLSTALVVTVQHLASFPTGPRWFAGVVLTGPLFFGELGSLILLLRCGWLLFHRRLSWIEEQCLLASAASFLYAFLSSFSWVTATNILVPAFPFAFAFALSHVRKDRAGRLVQAAAVVLVLFSLVLMANLKMQSPYGWAGWREGKVSRATAELPYPELRGIKVTPETAGFVERLVADIQQHSRPDEPVAEFCCMPILYLLAHRQPATFAYAHYIDVTPDDVFREDAQRLVINPPAVVVTLVRSEEELREGEIYFRGGKPSGERLLSTALKNLAPRYRLEDVLTTPITNKRVEVWVRQDR